MLLLRILVLLLAMVAAIILAVAANVWWVTLLAVLLLVAVTIAAVISINHMTSAPEWLGGSDEALLEREHLVERETGLPSRSRWRPSRSGYVHQAGGLLAVPDGWRGPAGAHRVLLVNSVPVAAERLRAAV